MSCARLRNFGMTRNMVCCAVAGQGAGIAAAQAVKHHRELVDVNISQCTPSSVAKACGTPRYLGALLGYG